MAWGRWSPRYGTQVVTLDLAQDTASLTAALVDVFSESGDETEVTDAVAAALEPIGHLSVDRDGDAVVARTSWGRPERVVLAGHLDTVPAAGNFPSQRDGDALRGLGSADMKGGIAVMLRLATAVASSRRDITYVFYDGEEVEAERNGLLRLTRRHPDWLTGDFAVLLEPTDAIVEGGCQGTMRVDGRVPARRADLVRADGLDLAVVALSSPIGIEALPREEADGLIEAYLRGVAGLGPEFAAWGPVALDRPNPADVDARIADGCVGISLPAAALDGAEAIEQIGPVLDRIAAHRVPLFVHPGPGPGTTIETPALNEPLWWRALTDYVTQMQSAWLTFAALDRREHPELPVLFALLAGCAPLQSERLTARGGPAPDLRDPLTYYDTSSYGPNALATLSGLVGPEQLVYGSDRPVVEPRRTGLEPVTMVAGARLIEHLGVPA